MRTSKWVDIMKTGKSLKETGLIIMASVLLSAVTSRGREAGANFFPSFADKHTVGLWLFDEMHYPGTTLADAGEHWYDLRLLEDGGRLVEGRFGNALQVSAAGGLAVCYASVPKEGGERTVDGRGGLFAGTTVPQRLVNTLTQTDWTWEFWMKLGVSPRSEAVIIDLGQGFEPGFYLALEPGTQAFVLHLPDIGVHARCPTDAKALSDGQWHHVAFTREVAGSRLCHFVDGRAQAEPKEATKPRGKNAKADSSRVRGLTSLSFKGEVSIAARMEKRFNFSLGTDRRGEKGIDVFLDELRFCDVVRYTGDFKAPASFSRNYGVNPPQPSVPVGPPLLFSPDSPQGPVQLGSRKHLFIDDALIERRSKVTLTVNPPRSPVPTNVRIRGEKCVYDDNGKIHMVVTPGYGSQKGEVRLFTSSDGIHFQAPRLGLVESNGSKENNLLMVGARLNARAFKDPNPNAEPEARYKLAAWLAQRGIYLFVSPDGIHWRRNETIMLPLVSGGGSECFWDDQRGLYVYYMKRDSSFRPGRGRRASMAQTQEIFKPWPFKRLSRPYFEGWAVPAITEELPVVLDPTELGQVYRTRAVKYQWAPDVYLAFIWRYQSKGNFRQTELATSRDAVHWKTYGGDPWYIPAGITYNGQKIDEALSDHGLIRRNDEIWQYAAYKVGLHGEHSQSTQVRLVQRLDGFVSLDAGTEPGWIITRPLVFRGSHLTVNAAAQESMRVAILDEKNNEIEGFGLADCDPIQADSTRHMVSWRKNTDVSKVAGKVVRLKFEMQDAKLYALKFD